MSDSATIPAWKRLGLKVKAAEDNPIAIAHIESGIITNKQAKTLNKQKRKAAKEEGYTPKRAKVPKSERGPPPEKDQLAYLRQYHIDRDAWKFSKQKQNWILRHIRDIPRDYEDALAAYLEGIQGGSRDRVVEDLHKVVAKWNDLLAVAESKVMAELEKRRRAKEMPSAEAAQEPEETPEKETLEKETLEKEETSVDEAYARRCQSLIRALTDELVTLRGLDNLIIDTVEVSGHPHEFAELMRQQDEPAELAQPEQAEVAERESAETATPPKKKKKSKKAKHAA